MLQEYLKGYRYKNNLTQKQMAHNLQTTQSYYCELESGRRVPGFKMTSKLASFFKVSESYIRKLCK